MSYRVDFEFELLKTSVDLSKASSMASVDLVYLAESNPDEKLLWSLPFHIDAFPSSGNFLKSQKNKDVDAFEPINIFDTAYCVRSAIACLDPVIHRSVILLPYSDCNDLN
jgi:hypothetical protein